MSERDPKTAGSTDWNDPVRCQWCGSFHSARCPQVQAIEFHQNGAVKRVEFVKPEQIDWRRVIEAAGNTPSVWQPLAWHVEAARLNRANAGTTRTNSTGAMGAFGVYTGSASAHETATRRLRKIFGT